MFRRNSFISIIILIIPFLLLAQRFQYSSIDQSKNKWVTAKSGLRMRKDPNTSSRTISSLKYGSMVRTIMIQSTKKTINGVTGSWEKIRFQNSIGWVFNAYLKRIKSFIINKTFHFGDTFCSGGVQSSWGCFFTIQRNNCILYKTWITEIGRFGAIKEGTMYSGTYQIKNNNIEITFHSKWKYRMDKRGIKKYPIHTIKISVQLKIIVCKCPATMITKLSFYSKEIGAFLKKDVRKPSTWTFNN